MSAIRKRNLTKLKNQYTEENEIARIAKTRKQKQLFRRLAVFFVFALFLSILLVSTFISQTSALEQKQADYGKREKELSSLQKQQVVLEEEIVKLNDEEYIAKLARRDFFLSEKGEIIFNLPEKVDGNR